MPEKHEATPEEFAAFDKKMLELGFRQSERREVINDIIRFNLGSSRPSRGREAGYSFHANGLTVQIWTSWLIVEKKFRKDDEGWILIKQDDNARYFSHPFHRTKYFFDNVLEGAVTAKKRVLGRPLCPECRQFMQIQRRRDATYTKYVKAVFWGCIRIMDHPSRKEQHKSWDCALSKEEIKKLRAKRLDRARQRDKKRSLGEVVIPAVRKRIPSWRKNLPPKE